MLSSEFYRSVTGGCWQGYTSCPGIGPRFLAGCGRGAPSRGCRLPHIWDGLLILGSALPPPYLHLQMGVGSRTGLGKVEQVSLLAHQPGVTAKISAVGWGWGVFWSIAIVSVRPFCAFGCEKKEKPGCLLCRYMAEGTDSAGGLGSRDSPRDSPRTLLMALFHRKSKTKPNGKKPPTEEKKHYLESEYTKVRVVDFDLKELVVLPREIDLNEWLASSTTTFFNLINLQYSTISEFCTGETCQAMTACNTIYYWYDEKGKKTKCTAPQYVDFVMSLVQKLVTDEDIFPTKYGKEFPNSFESLVKKICRYLFHVLAHIYWAHFKETVALDLQGHLNTLYAHFIVFIREFNLVDPKETSIMDDLSEILCTPSPTAQNHVTER
uniref:MOB kinase activator 2 n=2 Tax=Paramormyrops kingsleyae TaxID=1676925 RepID=A0A3B3RA39_9TELE